MRRSGELLLKGGAIFMAAAFIVSCFLAYFLRSFDLDTGQTLDGFGRPLSRGIFSDYESPGIMWAAVDMIWFWGGLFLIFKLWGLGDRLRTSSKQE